MAVNLSKGQKISLDKGMTLALVGDRKSVV